MRVKEFHIKNFRSISDSGVIKLDSYLNTFIGANEAGKTSALMALRTFGTDWEYDEDDLCTFSELWEMLQSDEIDKKEIEIISVTFELDEEDKIKLLKIDDEWNIDIIKLTKNFDNNYHIKIEGINLDEVISVRRTKEVNNNIASIEEQLSSLRNSFKLWKDTSSSPDLHKKLDESAKEIVLALKNYPDNVNEIIGENYHKIRGLAPDDTILHNIDGVINNIEPYRVRIQKVMVNDSYLFEDILEILPNFEYFVDYEELKNSYNFNDFIENKGKYGTLDKLMELIGWNIDNYRSKNSTGKKLDLARVSNKLTKMFNEFWNQDKITFEIHIDDEIFVLVKDGLTEMPQYLSMRSQGLRSALSLFINVMSIPENSIILLDDPGVHLHPSGQKDILKIMEEISKKKQIIFSTHSPFMVNRDDLDRIKIIIKGENGTQIKEKFHASDYDALEPIRASIGMTLGDSLFTTKKNLLVEGRSDWLMLEAMSYLSSKKSMDFIDAAKVSIVPTNGGNVNIMALYTTLLEKEKLDYVVLLDYDVEGNRTFRILKEKFELDDKVKTLDILFDKNTLKGIKSIDIEDLFNFEFYLSAFNLAYKEIFKRKGAKEITNKEVSSFSDIEEYFKVNRSTIGNFDKILVAKKIYEMILNGNNPNDDTINKFSNLFKIVNECLNI